MARERIVKVLIDGATSDLTFTYLIPNELRVASGQRVRVPLRNRSAVGTVTSIEEVDTDALKYRLKPILGVVSEDSFLTEGLLKLAEWISNFYLTPIETVIRTMLPKPSRGEEEKRKTAKFVELAAVPDEEVLASFNGRQKKQKEALLFIRDLGSASLADLTGTHGISRPVLKALEERGLVRMVDQIVSRDHTGEVEYVESEALTLND